MYSSCEDLKFQIIIEDPICLTGECIQYPCCVLRLSCLARELIELYVVGQSAEQVIRSHSGIRKDPRDRCSEAALSDIREISCYVSSRDGGDGCARDVIEQVLRAQGKWLSSAEAFGW